MLTDPPLHSSPPSSLRPLTLAPLSDIVIPSPSRSPAPQGFTPVSDKHASLLFVEKFSDRTFWDASLRPNFEALLPTGVDFEEFDENDGDFVIVSSLDPPPVPPLGYGWASYHAGGFLLYSLASPPAVFVP